MLTSTHVGKHGCDPRSSRVRGCISAKIVAVVLAAACVPIPAPGEIEDADLPFFAEARLADGEGVVVLHEAGEGSDGDSVAECLRDSLRDGNPPVPVVAARPFRAALDPWMKALSQIGGDEHYALVLAEPLIREKIAGIGVRHLIFATSHRSEGNTGGVEAVMAGVWGVRETTTVRARVIDLKAAQALGTAQVTAGGTEGVAHVMLYGVILLAATEGSACNELGRQLVAAFHGDAEALATPAGDRYEPEPSRGPISHR